VCAALLGLTSGCGSMFGGGSSQASSPLAESHDPTPLAKCKIAASSDSPLVTEWPASEKAHLQSLASRQMVAVQYSGCELKIVDGCRLPGNYRWQHTTLATDTVEIENADELYAKLPIGAVGLEGELQRSGRLAVRTMVSGQLTSELENDTPPATGDCAKATHYVSSISVGAFKLLSGATASGGGEVGVAGVGAGAKHSSAESVLREAGSEEACAKSSDEAPETECASPIQVFLRPLRRGSESASATASGPLGPESARAGAIQVVFPPPRDTDETWSLRDRTGSALCTLPCEQWVPPASGYYLQREEPHGELRLPLALPHKPGTTVSADYRLQRGDPTLSTLTFYFFGLPAGAMGTGLVIWGIAVSGCQEDRAAGKRCFPPAGFLIGSGAMFTAIGGASAWWYFWSHSERFDTREQLPASARRSEPSGVRIMLGPGSLSGTF
jgi:hypothetical protein